MEKINVTKINYLCGCIGEIYQEKKEGKNSMWKSSTKKIVCPHN